ncbi:MAG: uracil-DNA glycosylase [Victivallaceae bacterium]|nr:uracil-DNA glycosylase [Victivallaceae bacterium]
MMEFFEQLIAVLQEQKPGDMPGENDAAVMELMASAVGRRRQTPQREPARPAAVRQTQPREPMRQMYPRSVVPATAPCQPAERQISPPPQAISPVRSIAPFAAATMEELRSAVAGCKSCGLCEKRLNPVFGEGNPHAELMFIGEGPGRNEDEQGRPFVGDAGELLTKMILAMQFRREDVFIANIVKCRPPLNRVPTSSEAEACLPFLLRQIELVSPKVIVLLGGVATKILIDPETGITKMRGRWMKFRGIDVMPTYHPAYLLRCPSDKRLVWSDLQMVMAKFGKTPPGRRG